MPTPVAPSARTSFRSRLVPSRRRLVIICIILAAAVAAGVLVYRNYLNQARVLFFGSYSHEWGAPTQPSLRDPLTTMVAIPDPSFLAELDGVLPLSSAAVEAAAELGGRARDSIASFKTVMERRYAAHDGREAQSGGFVDLEKAGLARKTRDDVVEWRYLRNARTALLTQPADKIAAYLRHTRLATERHCELLVPSEAAWSKQNAWRVPYELHTNVPVSAEGFPVISARELVRRRVHVWQPHPETDDFLSRPTVLCVTVLSRPANLELALTQFRLWGRFCEEHHIFVPNLPSDVTVGTDFEGENTPETARKLAEKYGLPAKWLHMIEIKTVAQPAELEREAAVRAADAASAARFAAGAEGPKPAPIDPRGEGGHGQGAHHRNEQIARSKWQMFRQVCQDLDKWVRFGFFEYVYFVDERVYTIPENLYAMLSEPETSLLHSLGTPLLLGNRMMVPPDGAGQSAINKLASTGRVDEEALKKLAASTGVDTHGRLSDISFAAAPGAVPYVAGDAFLMNSVALRLFVSRMGLPECAPHESTAAADVALAACFIAAGVYPRDTADHKGHDRIAALSLNWLARTAVDPESSWWYPRYRPRPMPRGYGVLSEHAVAVPLVQTAPDMATLHAWIFAPTGVSALTG